MTPKGRVWSDEQKRRQSQRMAQIAERRTAAERRISALRGHATRRILRELRRNQSERNGS